MATNTGTLLNQIWALILIICCLTSANVVVQSRFVKYQQVSCPRPEFIQPCTCRMTVYGMHVVCLRVSNVHALQRIFTVLKDYELGTLLLQDFQLPSYNQCNQLFQGLKPVILRLVTCALPTTVSPNDGQVQGSPYILEGMGSALKRIDITKCNIGSEGLQLLGLGRLPQLNEVNVLHEQLGVVGQDWFKMVPGQYLGGHDNLKIKTVRLEESGITTVESKAFAALTNLQILSLAKNSINTIARNVFPDDAPFLSTIDLSFNALTGLPRDFFNNMPALRKVVLHNNKITSMDEATWRHIFLSLNTLWIGVNPLNCDSSMSWLMTSRKPQDLEGTCDFPDHKKGIHLTDNIAYLSEEIAEMVEMA